MGVHEIMKEKTLNMRVERKVMPPKLPIDAQESCTGNSDKLLALVLSPQLMGSC